MSIWQPEHDAALRKYREEGYSSSQIAAQLWGDFHVRYSRNAVIGRMHRLGLTKPMVRRAEPKPKPRRHQPYKPRSAAPVLPPADLTQLRCVEVTPRGLTLLDLDDTTCKYPYGENAPFAFCGHPPIPGSPYCGPHFALTVRT